MEDQYVGKLRQLYQVVLEDVSKARDKRRKADRSALATSDITDFNDAWEAKRKEHLPLSRELIEARWNKPARHNKVVPLDYGRKGEDDPTNRVLLMMGGFSVEQLALTMAFHRDAGQVKKIVLFTGAGVCNQIIDDLQRSLEFLNLTDTLKMLDPEDMPFGDTSNPAKVFQAVLNWTRGAGKDYRACAIDVTGGQKPMDSGATYAAMYLGWPAYYLDFTEYDVAGRRPKPWSLQYSKLDLPSVVFSHDARKSIVTNFASRRFSLALNQVEELKQGVTDFRQYFESVNGQSAGSKTELQRIEEAEGIIKTCSHWLTGTVFPEDQLPKEAEKTTQRNSNTLRQNYWSYFRGVSLREGLRNLMTDAGAGNPAPLAAYIRDEYHRLKAIYNPTSDKNDGTQSENTRDVLVGSVGLAEVIIDAIFCSKHVKVTADVRSMSLEDRKGQPKVLKGRPQKATLSEPTDVKWKTLLMPWQRLPRSNSKQKVALLCGFSNADGRDNFRFKVRADDALFKWPGKSELIDAEFIKRLDEVSEVGLNDPSIAIRNDIRCEPIIVGKGQDDDEWIRHWGDVGDGDAHWFGTRHMIAHMRVPITDMEKDVAKNALNEYLPRLIGVWKVVFDGATDQLPVTSETAKSNGDKFLNESPFKVPWEQPNQSEADLCELLSLPKPIAEKGPARVGDDFKGAGNG